MSQMSQFHLKEQTADSIVIKLIAIILDLLSSLLNCDNIFTKRKFMSIIFISIIKSIHNTRSCA